MTATSRSWPLVGQLLSFETIVVPEVLHFVGRGLEPDVLPVRLGQVTVLGLSSALLALAREGKQALAQLGICQAELVEERVQRRPLMPTRPGSVRRVALGETSLAPAARSVVSLASSISGSQSKSRRSTPSARPRDWSCPF
jgi:hypothetical protein